MPLEIKLDVVPHLKGLINGWKISGRWERYSPITVVLKRKSKWHDLWSKWPISDLMFYNIKMPPSSCPLGFSLLLTGALKWGTVQTSTSTYTGIMQGRT